MYKNASVFNTVCVFVLSIGTFKTPVIYNQMVRVEQKYAFARGKICGERVVVKLVQIQAL